jgi:hypothetical protein
MERRPGTSKTLLSGCTVWSRRPRRGRNRRGVSPCSRVVRLRRAWHHERAIVALVSYALTLSRSGGSRPGLRSRLIPRRARIHARARSRSRTPGGSFRVTLSPDLVTVSSPLIAGFLATVTATVAAALIRELRLSRRRATIRKSRASSATTAVKTATGTGDRDDGNECRTRPHHGAQREAEAAVERSGDAAGRVSGASSAERSWCRRVRTTHRCRFRTTALDFGEVWQPVSRRVCVATPGWCTHREASSRPYPTTGDRCQRQHAAGYVRAPAGYPATFLTREAGSNA